MVDADRKQMITGASKEGCQGEGREAGEGWPAHPEGDLARASVVQE